MAANRDMWMMHMTSCKFLKNMYLKSEGNSQVEVLPNQDFKFIKFMYSWDISITPHFSRFPSFVFASHRFLSIVPFSSPPLWAFTTSLCIVFRVPGKPPLLPALPARLLSLSFSSPNQPNLCKCSISTVDLIYFQAFSSVQELLLSYPRKARLWIAPQYRDQGFPRMHKCVPTAKQRRCLLCDPLPRVIYHY